MQYPFPELIASRCPHEIVLRWHLHRHPDLIHEHVDRLAFRRDTRDSIAMGPIAYALGAGLAWVSQIGAFVCYGALALYTAKQPDC